MEGIAGLLMQLLSGGIGGNLAGAVLEKYSPGPVGNTIAGAVGGGIGGQLIGAAAEGLLGQILGGRPRWRRRRGDVGHPRRVAGVDTIRRSPRTVPGGSNTR